MSRYHSYLNSATAIIKKYDGTEPLTSFLKKIFSTNKKYGSKDRKLISHLCYCYFRLGNALPNISIEDKILIALFLCSSTAEKILEELKPGSNEKIDEPLHKKLATIIPVFSHLFPWKDELSAAIDYEKFCASFFIQPDLFLRLRPGKEEVTKNKLRDGGIDFAMLSDDCLALSNSSKLDSIIELNKEAVIQDFSSQRVKELLPLSVARRSLAIWDCCAASGGKSIMAKDILGDITLTVSDIRTSILANLKKRFHEAGIIKYKSFVADLTHSSQAATPTYDLIIADVPCSGSGTWSRTPEQLCFFDSSMLKEFVALQKGILRNIIPYLKSGGYLLYITCSVFQKENEEAVAFILANSTLQLKRQELITGYDKKADTMFAALFQA